MTSGNPDYERAKELRASGLSYEKIRRELGKSARTISRWLKDQSKPRQKRQDIPADRTWVDWSIEELGQKIGWAEQQAESELAGIRTAQQLGNYHYPWYMRRMVETVEHLGANPSQRSKIDPWLLAIAGLPVLGDWLGECSECDLLAALIEDSCPWEDKKTLRLYEKEARPLAETINQRIFLAMTEWNLRSGHKGIGPGLQESPPLLLEALVQRIPLFDKSPLLSRFRLYKMQHLFAKLFIFPKGGPK